VDPVENGVLAVARGVLEELDVEQVLARILDAARELTGARYAALGLLDPTRTHLERFLTAGIDEEGRRRIGPPPMGRGVLGELIRNPEPVRLGDVGRHAFSQGFPAGHPPMRTFLGVPVCVAGEPYGSLYLTEKAGGPFTEEDERSLIALADLAGLAIDHARRFTSTETERAQLARTVQALDATIQITRALGGETDLHAILSLVATRGRALVAARTLVIELLVGDELEFAAGAGEVPEGLIGRRVPLADTVASVALATGQPQDLEAPGNRGRFDAHGAGAVGVTAQHALVVPLIFRDRPYGVLAALDCLEGRFDAERQRLLEAFAASTAIAVATATSAADERRRQTLAAAEAERTRWARELHDETLQSMANLRLILYAAQRTRDASKLNVAVDQVLEQLSLDVSSLRSLITELRPAALDQLGLEPALAALMDRARRTGAEVDATIDLAWERGTAPTRLTAELETGIYRILQEALTNIAKHADATSVRVSVTEDDHRVCVTVSDDGGGFDTAVGSDGFGLAGIKERVELLAGTLTVRSAPAEGTELRATFTAHHRPSDAAAAALDGDAVRSGR
jgi:signal transduction histidine kinase